MIDGTAWVVAVLPVSICGYQLAFSASSAKLGNSFRLMRPLSSSRVARGSSSKIAMTTGVSESILAKFPAFSWGPASAQIG